MATSSTIPAVKAALVSVLSARPGLAGVKVAWGWPGPDAAAEMVVVGGVPSASQRPPVMRAGRVQREERYEVEVACVAARPEVGAQDARLAEQRAFALAAEVEGALADDPRLGLTEIAWATVDRLEVESAPADRGWVARVSVFVQVVARLT